MLAVVGDRERDVEAGEGGAQGLVVAGEAGAGRMDADDGQAEAAEVLAEPADERQGADAAQLPDLEEVDEQRPARGDPLGDGLGAADPGEPGWEGGEGDAVAAGKHAARMPERADRGDMLVSLPT